MSYFDNNLLADERILFRTKKHIIIFFYPLVWSLFSIYASDYMRSNPILARLDWLPWVLALVLWVYTSLEYVFSEFAVTNKRVMMREGFFFRHANETRIATISQVNVNQNLVGVLLNYGMVTINAFGAFDTFTLIAKPLEFQKYVNSQIDSIAK